ALESRPNGDDIYLNRGVAQYLLGNYGAAVTDFDEALRIAPNSKSAKKNRGIAFKKLQETQK
ncbi:unnamed protein product, partial [Scytosiphon promiscuus]